MTTANLQAFFAAKLSLKHESNYTTQDVWLASREPFDDITHTYLNLLRQLNGMGQTVGVDLPVVSTGSIVVLDEVLSLEHERKLSDLLHRYTAINQQIIVYQSFVDLDNLALGANLTPIFRGRVKNWQSNRDQTPATMTFNIESVNIEDRLMTKVVDRVSFPACPDSSVGKTVPIVFGYDVEVSPVRITADGANPMTEVYAVTLGTEHINLGIIRYLAKNLDGDYFEVRSAAATSTALFDSAPTLSFSVDYFDKQDKVGWNLPGYSSSTTNYISTGGQMTFKGNLGGGWDTDSTLTFELWEKNISNGKPEKMVASAEVEKLTHRPDFRTTNYFSIEWCWDKPVPLTHPQGYVLVHGQTTNEDDTDRVNFAGNNTFYPYYRFGYYIGTKKTSGIWQYRPNNNHVNLFKCQPKFNLFGAVLSTSNPTAGEMNEEGLAHSWFSLTARAAPTGQVAPPLEKVDFIVSVHGLGDDAAGSITGTPSYPLSNPYWVLKCLTKTWDGANWDYNTDDYNPEAFADTLSPSALFAVSINGRTEGATTLQQLMQAILKNSFSKLIAKNDGKMGFYFYGTHRAKTFEFTDDNCNIIGVKELGTESIVNRFQGFFDRTLSTVTVRESAAEGSFKNYAAALDWSHETNSYTAISSTDSFNVFGTRTLNKKASGFDWLKSDSMEPIARYHMTLYPFPHRIVQVRVPFNEWSFVELMDCGEIQSVELPNFFGTTPAARKPVYNGVECDINRGRHYIRAERYRVQVIQKDYDLNFGNAPGIVFTLRIVRAELGDNT